MSDQIYRPQVYPCPDPWCEGGLYPMPGEGWISCPSCSGKGRFEGPMAALEWVRARAGMEHSESLSERWQHPLSRWQDAELPCADESKQRLRLALGVAEEAGEVARCVLKGDQDIRGGAEVWREKLSGEIGDVVVYLIQLATLNGLDFEECVEGAVCKVLARRFATAKQADEVNP